MTDAIQAGQEETFHLRFLIIIGMSLLFFIVRFLHRSFLDPIITERLGVYLDNRYLEMLYTMDNTYMETLGTGRAASLLWKGTTAWLLLLYDTIIANTSILIFFILASYQITKYAADFGILLFIFIVLSTLRIWRFNKKSS